MEQLKFNWKQWIKGKSTRKVDLDSVYVATYFTLGLLSLIFLELQHVLVLAPESSAEILQLLLVFSIASWKHLCCKRILSNCQGAANISDSGFAAAFILTWSLLLGRKWKYYGLYILPVIYTQGELSLHIYILFSFCLIVKQYSPQQQQHFSVVWRRSKTVTKFFVKDHPQQIFNEWTHNEDIEVHVLSQCALQPCYMQT